MPSIVLPESGAQVEIKDHIRLKMKKLREWVDADRTANLEAQYGFITPCIESWTLELDPADPASLDELEARDFFTLSRAISEVIRRTQTEKN